MKKQIQKIAITVFTAALIGLCGNPQTISLISAYASESSAVIEDVYWKGNHTAQWSVIGEFMQYEIELYRSGEKIATKKIDTTSRNFSTHMVAATDYYFRVRGQYLDGAWSNWITSEDKEIKESEKESKIDVPVASSTVIRGEGGPYSKKENQAKVTTETTIPQATAVSGQWINSSGRWWYQYSDGSYPSSTWVTIDNKRYHFDHEGWVTPGWINTDNSFSYCNEQGLALGGKQKIDGITYDFSSDGILKKKYAENLNLDQFLVTDKDGVCLGHWITENSTGRKWFRHMNGNYTVNGWELILGQWYFFDHEGWMKTGWVQDNGVWYYCNPVDGKMMSGRLVVDGKTYWTGPNGAIQESTTHHLNPEGF